MVHLALAEISYLGEPRRGWLSRLGSATLCVSHPVKICILPENKIATKDILCHRDDNGNLTPNKKGNIFFYNIWLRYMVIATHS